MIKDYRAALEAAEKAIYLEAYREAKQNKSKAARLLGVSRSHFYAKLKEWSNEK